MPKFTVVLGDFADYPDVWNEHIVEAESANDIDLDDVADKVYEYLCKDHLDPDDEDDREELEKFNPEDRGTYTVVGVYVGAIECASDW